MLWDGTPHRPLGRQLATPTEIPKAATPPTKAKRVFGYTLAIYRQAKVYRQLKDCGPQTRAELLAATGLTPDRLREALRDLLLHDRIQVAQKVRVSARGRLRYVYEAICRS